MALQLGGPCRHLAVSRLVSEMDLDGVGQVEYAAKATPLVGAPVAEFAHNSATQARADRRQFLEHLILRAEAVWNYQPPVLFRHRVPGGSCGARMSASRSCRPSWATCATRRSASRLVPLAADASGSRSVRLVSPTRRYTGFSRMYRFANFVA